MAQLQTAEYSDFSGVDLVTPLIVRSPNSAELMQNCTFKLSGSVARRAGWKYRAKNAAGDGFDIYSRNEAGLPTKTRLIVAERLYKLTENNNFRISYSGSAGTVFATCLYDTVTSQWRFQLLEGTTEVLNFAIGKGMNEVSFITLANLKTAIDAVTNFAATITGATTGPAAFLPTLYREAFDSVTPLDIPFNTSDAVRKPVGAVDCFAAHYGARHLTSHRLATFLNHKQVIYIASETSLLQKYDGVSVYNAGVQKGAASVAGQATGGAITATWRYRIRLSHTDAKLNYNPGSLTTFLPVTISAKTGVDVTVTVPQTNSGYATDYAKVNGAQVGVTTITVDSGHSLQIGDLIWILDRSVSAVLATQRTVTNRTNTTVTISGAAVNVSDDDIISNGGLVEIYRTKNNGALLYTIAKLPLNPASATQVFSDTTVDASVGALFTAPTRQPDPPPIGGVIVSHQGVPVITRIPAYPNRIYYADASNQEGFPEATNYEDLYSLAGGVITALGPNIAGMEVYYDSSTYRLLGSLGQQLEFRQVSLAVGCVHQHCWKQLDSSQMVWISRQGPRQMGPGGYPQKIGNNIDSLFREMRFGSEKFVLERSMVLDNPIEGLCYFFLNAESKDGSGNVYTNNYAQTWVLDHQLNDYRWIGPWTNMNMGGGALVLDGKLCFLERRFETETATIVGDLVEQMKRQDLFDYIDHYQQPVWEWRPSFESGGDKYLKKFFQYLRVYSSDLQAATGFTVTVLIEKNYRRNATVSSFRMAFGAGGAAGGWGFDPWGQFAWGMPDSAPLEERIPSTNVSDNAGNSLRTVFTHSTIYETPIITAFGLAIRFPMAKGKAEE